ncbi:MAG: anti-sigma factor family protein [Methyloceanibacter sp.]
MTELSDELLVAYVDGQLARKQTRAVEKVLEQDDVIARRVDALKQAHRRLEAAFEAILAGEEAEISAVSAQHHAGVSRLWRVAAIALASLCVAGGLMLSIAGFGWPLPVYGLTQELEAAPMQIVDVVPDRWQERVARAHALLDRASVEVGLESQGNRDFVSLARALGQDLKITDLGPQGFNFVRAQILRDGAEPLVQILYLGERGAPLALYVRKGEGIATLTHERHGSIGGVSWAEDGLSYLLAGQAEDKLLMRLATKIKLDRLPPPVSVPVAPAPSGRPL